MIHALLRTLPGRAIVVGLAVKLFLFFFVFSVFSARVVTGNGVPAFVRVVDSVASVAIVVGAVYFVGRAFIFAKRRLLWRVRRKLILSYIFIGLVPASLIAAFFVLCGLLLFCYFSSYLVQTELQTLTSEARFVATSAALEIQRSGGRDVAGIINQKQNRAASALPGLSLAVVPIDRPCDRPAVARPVESSLITAGPWRHVRPPAAVPGWIGCSGFAGLLAYSPARAQLTRGEPGSPGSADDTHILVRAAAFPDSSTPGYAVIVDIPVGDDIRQRVRRNTGVDLRSVSAVDTSEGTDVDPNPLPGGSDSGATTVTAAASGPLSWVTFVEYRDWDSGRPGSLLVATRLNIGEIYDRIAAAQGLIGNRSFGQVLLLVLLVVVGGLFLLIEIVALFAGFALAKSITGSVHELFAGTERVRQGDFTHKIGVTAADQLGELAGSFNSMTASIENLLVEQAEKKRLEEELRIAHEIQMSLLPQGPLTMAGLSVSALCVPAREVGGDYYDFLPLDERRVGLLIADVSGKGTSAALYMAELKGLVLSLSRIHTSPRELLISANRIISDHLDARSFITMTYAVLDLDAGTMTYARAGHTPLIHVPGPGAASRAARILSPDGLVLGLKIDGGEMFERLLQEESIPLHPGDLYLFFTDGISEAMNTADDCFGEARLGELVERHADLPPEELRERVLREIEAFVGDAPRHDDMTMILLKIDGPAAAVANTGTGRTAVHAEAV